MSSFPPLRRIHTDAVLEATRQRSLNFFRKMSTAEIVKSLHPDSNGEPLIVKADGRIVQGNTRIKVLEERGFDINSLPRTVIS